jgi:hypothetical protein
MPAIKFIKINHLQGKPVIPTRNYGAHTMNSALKLNSARHTGTGVIAANKAKTVG